ncbi:MAG: endo-1,4-beta-xylanase [Planctomycetota bacterium]
MRNSLIGSASQNLCRGSERLAASVASAGHALWILALVGMWSLPCPGVGAEGRQVQKLPSPTSGVDDAADRAVMEEARRSIEKHRKGDFDVQLVDKNGKPLQGKVSLELVRHEFRFGALMNSVLNRKGPEGTRGEEVVEELFNHVVVPRHWWQAQSDRQQGEGHRPMDLDEPLKVHRWALARGMSMRYHALFYAPPRWAAEVETEDQWWRYFETYVRGVAERFGDTVFEYDAINEPFSFKPYMMKVHGARSCLPDLADPAVGERALRIAREHLPRAKLVMLNYWEIGDPRNLGFRRTFDYYQKIIERGAPVDLVGFQAHFYGQKVAMKDISAGLDHFATLGKPMVVTEFNGPSRLQGAEHVGEPWDPQTHAAWVENFYTLVFSKPYMEGLTRWFIYPTMGGRALDSGLLNKDGTVRPEYESLRRLLKETWTTRHAAEPDAEGKVRFRGFFGAYRVGCDGREVATLQLLKREKGATVRLVVDAE